MAVSTINPSTDEVIGTFEELTGAQVEEKLQRAAEAFFQFRHRSFEARAAAMYRAADIVTAEADAFGHVMTLEMGKLARAGRDEAFKCAWGCRYYAEHAATLLADAPVSTNAAASFVRYQPLGAILAVMPWNFPFWQVFRLAAPALMAGNVVLLKHASNVPQCALLIEDIFRRAGFPEGVFQTLLIEVSQLPSVLDDPRVAAVSLTGSENGGKVSGRQCRPAAEEGRAGTRRQRSLHCHAKRGSRCRG